METLKIVGIVVGLLLVAGGIYGFFGTCKEKFNYHFFTKGSFISMTVAVGFGFLGKYLLETTMRNSAGNYIGLVLLVVAGLIVIVMVCRNFFETNFWYGLFGSVLQLSILGFAGLFTIALLMIYAAIQLFSAVVATGDSGKDDKDDDDDDDDWAHSDKNPASANFDEKSYFSFFK